MTIRVLIVDDHAVVRAGLTLLLNAEDDIEAVGEAGTAREAIFQARELKPDLVLMDVNLPGINGLDATRQILADLDPVVVLLLSTYEYDEYAPKAAECGAAAYIPKSEFMPDRLEQAWSEAAPTAG
jgi:two-component system response regulator NreC